MLCDMQLFKVSPKTDEILMFCAWNERGNDEWWWNW